jgi:hypothetical protein
MVGYCFFSFQDFFGRIQLQELAGQHGCHTGLGRGDELIISSISYIKALFRMYKEPVCTEYKYFRIGFHKTFMTGKNGSVKAAC